MDSSFLGALKSVQPLNLINLYFTHLEIGICTKPILLTSLLMQIRFHDGQVCNNYQWPTSNNLNLIPLLK